ncbi:bifunctional 2-polyprenyl-6-hydroxyphenol methylase/3-demethylubiquinol 3-O-methyltransferase UbiG [Methanoregula sp.]|uniref:class I SAM-dependent methyltransferase n=1 Tax=Methanoregula sp. TaxID=2052170 RepID=UPI0025E0A7D3|nr:class I SAM-dependent methyltransferase [Methanoregula sp.]
MPVREHYDRFLAGEYAWMAGGFEINLDRNRRFFHEMGIVPRSSNTALDLGAGCGFAAIPLAEAGFRVTAVDFCRPLLDELVRYAPDIVTVEGDILDFPLWAGRNPELIICMGDTLTHLPNAGSVQDLLRQCYAELVPGGRFILALRDYSREVEGSVVVIPVQREQDRIFLCRLEYQADHVGVKDVLYSRESGSWERSYGEYRKLRIAPAFLERELEREGFRIEKNTVGEGHITMIVIKEL